MVFWNLIFNPEVVEQRLRAGVRSHHEQQASERGQQPQHHKLWPAYNVTSVQEQASSRVLFQQTRVILPTVQAALEPVTISEHNDLQCELERISNDTLHARS